MPKLDLTQEQIDEILDYTDGTNISVGIIFKLAIANNTVPEVLGSEPAELLATISRELTETGNDNLIAYAINLYKQETS